MERGHVALLGDGPADQIKGRFMLALLGGGNAEQMQAVGMARLSLQYLAIDRLGLGQAAGLVQPDAIDEQILQGSGVQFGPSRDRVRTALRAAIPRAARSRCDPSIARIAPL